MHAGACPGAGLVQGCVCAGTDGSSQAEMSLQKEKLKRWGGFMQSSSVLVKKQPFDGCSV